MSHLRRHATALLLLSALGTAHAAETAPNQSTESIDVVIDPGHGGSNTGSPGRGEVYEKHVTLAIAKAVRRYLREAGVHVAMTRTRDEYVPIRARARVANALQPKCFVSIHTNASPDHTKQGVETYLLSRDATDIHAHRAARLAATDAEALVAEQRVLAHARGSLDLAKRIQQGLLGGASVPDGSSYFPQDRAVRQAAHDVLGDAEVPAILVEAGFLDHPVEGRVLASVNGQAQVARRIADGIIGFLQRGTSQGSSSQALSSIAPFGRDASAGAGLSQR